jgi:hypothetical protein
MNYFFGARQCRSITFVDDVAGSLNGYYFDLNAIKEDYVEQSFYVFLTNGTAVDPALPNKLKIEVTIADNDTAATIKGLVKAAIDSIAVGNPFITYDGDLLDTLEIENRFLGETTAEDFTNAPLFTYTLNSEGFGGELGAVASGGSTLSTGQELVDIQSDQTGAIVLNQIITGGSITLEIPLIEMNTANWERLVGKVFGDIEDVNGSELVGYGTSKLYTSSFDYAGQLVGHPVRKPLTDRSEDIVFWKTAPVLNSLNYSGTDIQQADLSFTALRDTTKPETINQFARGDHSLL